MTYSLFVFDVDKTLSRSKEPIEPAMASALRDLLEKGRVAVISGDSLSVIERDVIARLPEDANLNNLSVLPTSGAALYARKDDTWLQIYNEEIAREKDILIEAAIRSACEETGLIDLSAPSYGERIEYRGGEITVSALGQEAPITEKEAWDPTGIKKKALRDAIAKRLPSYDVKTGGSTSVDITKRGVNKAYGIRQLSDYLSIPISDMLYIGDALYPNGNDEVVKETGIATRQVAGPEETLSVISSLL